MAKDIGEKEESIVYIVDDDSSLRDALAQLVRVVGMRAESFDSAQEFLKKALPSVTSCLVLDMRLPRTSGLNVQEELAKAGNPIPIIFMTAHGDIPMTVRAMKAGAVEFLPKPFRDQDMLDAINLALSAGADSIPDVGGEWRKHRQGWVWAKT